MTIEKIILREILDSRGNTTVEAEVSSADFTAIASAPSGASVGTHEVQAFPKGGTEEAVSVFNTNFRDKLKGHEANYHEFEKTLSDLNAIGELGGNSFLALTLAVAKLHAAISGIDLYEIFGSSYTLPYPIGNVIGGGVHSGPGSPEIQEFMCIPVGAKTFKDAALANCAVHKTIGKKLMELDKNFTRGRSDEGAWAPAIKREKALEILTEACAAVSDKVGFDVKGALDLAASEFYDTKEGSYAYKDSKKTTEEQVEYVASLIDEHGLFYVEDPFHEDDFDGFTALTKQSGSKCLIVGDDLTVTNTERLQKAIGLKACNALIVKPNQIASLVETEKVIKLAKDSNVLPIVSHRSGETTDNSIAHIAVGFSLPIIKTGAVGGERLAKINELIRLEEKIGAKMAKLH
ncbi:MAG: enolase C-terminal domain-like protein [archaeon]